jgi:hypothetical protein
MCTCLSEGGTNNDALKIKLIPPNKSDSIFCKSYFYMQRDVGNLIPYLKMVKLLEDALGL